MMEGEARRKGGRGVKTLTWTYRLTKRDSVRPGTRPMPQSGTPCHGSPALRDRLTSCFFDPVR
jgi:hypothetical protein